MDLLTESARGFGQTPVLFRGLHAHSLAKLPRMAAHIGFQPKILTYIHQKHFAAAPQIVRPSITSALFWFGVNFD